MSAPAQPWDTSAGHGRRLYLLRHARAEPKRSWTLPDAARPLTPFGEDQAKLLVERFAHRVRRVITSPTARCRQTVEPLAAARGLPIEETPALAVGSTVAALRQLAAEPDMDDAVWCTHGEVLRDLLDWLAPAGDGQPRRRAEKGGTWVVEDLAGTPQLGAYLRPPTGAAGSR